jgi:hypothetical protein
MAVQLVKFQSNNTRRWHQLNQIHLLSPVETVDDKWKRKKNKINAWHHWLNIAATMNTIERQLSTKCTVGNLRFWLPMDQKWIVTRTGDFWEQSPWNTEEHLKIPDKHLETWLWTLNEKRTRLRVRPRPIRSSEPDCHTRKITTNDTKQR